MYVKETFWIARHLRQFIIVAPIDLKVLPGARTNPDNIVEVTSLLLADSHELTQT